MSSIIDKTRHHRKISSDQSVPVQKRQVENTPKSNSTVQAGVGAKLEEPSTFSQILTGIASFLSAPCTRDSGCKSN